MVVSTLGSPVVAGRVIAEAGSVQQLVGQISSDSLQYVQNLGTAGVERKEGNVRKIFAERYGEGFKLNT